jgi:hypothetical protein
VSEINFERRCVTELRKMNNSYWPDKATENAIRGIPDRVGCVNGIYCAIEFKKNIQEARRTTGRIVLQKLELRNIKKAGGYAAIACPENWQDVKAELMYFCYGG